MLRLTCTALLVAACVIGMTAAGCDKITDTINDAAKQRQRVELRLGMIEVGIPEEYAGVPFDALLDEILYFGAFCLPEALSIDGMMEDEAWWDDAKGHLSAVEVEEVNYRIRKNLSAEDIHIRMYLTDSAETGEISEQDYFGKTNTIPAETNTNNPEWPSLNLSNTASDRVEDLILVPSATFAICVTIPEILDKDVDITQIKMEITMEAVAVVTFIPLD